MKAKYVIYVNDSGNEIVVMTCGAGRHDEIIPQGVLEDKSRIKGAGFIDIATLECYGRSASLKVESRGMKDSNLVRIHLKATM